MDLNDFWQENKRFVVTVVGGAIVFLVGYLAIERVFGSALETEEARKRRAETGLAGKLFQPEDLAQAETENKALEATLATLSSTVQFKPRPQFELGSGAPTNRYFNAVSETRDSLRTAAGRAGMKIPDELGLPTLSPSRQQEIARYLEAVDMIDRAARIAIESGVARVDEVHIKLDPRLLSGKGIEGVEKTLVEMKLRGDALALSRFVMLTQRAPADKTLLVERCEFSAAPGAKLDEARLDIALLAAHLHPKSDPDDRRGDGSR
jgi:hypothetical protein